MEEKITDERVKKWLTQIPTYDKAKIIHVAGCVIPVNPTGSNKSHMKYIVQTVMEYMREFFPNMKAITMGEFIERTMKKEELPVQVNLERLFEKEELDAMDNEKIKELYNLNNKVVVNISRLYEFLGDPLVDPTVGLVDIALDGNNGNVAIRLGVSPVYLEMTGMNSDLLMEIYLLILKHLTQKYDTHGAYMHYSRETMLEDTFITVYYGRVVDKAIKEKRALFNLKDSGVMDINTFLKLLDVGITYSNSTNLLKYIDTMRSNNKKAIKMIKDILSNNENMTPSDIDQYNRLLDVLESDMKQNEEKRKAILEVIKSFNGEYFSVFLDFNKGVANGTNSK